MYFKDHVRSVMMAYTDLFEKPIQVYDHILLSNGNEYSWSDGDILYKGYANFNVSVEDSINGIIDDNFSRIKTMKSAIANCNFPLFKDSVDNVDNIYKDRIKLQINRVLHVDDVLNDMSLPDNFEFSELNKYSLIANIPDNVNYVTLCEIKQFIEILDNNRDKFEDPDNLFNMIKDRIKSLFHSHSSEYAKLVETDMNDFSSLL